MYKYIQSTFTPCYSPVCILNVTMITCWADHETTQCSVLELYRNSVQLQVVPSDDPVDVNAGENCTITTKYVMNIPSIWKQTCTIMIYQSIIKINKYHSYLKLIFLYSQMYNVNMHVALVTMQRFKQHKGRGYTSLFIGWYTYTCV